MQGTESGLQTFTVSNAGDGPLHITGVDAAGDQGLIATEATPLYQVQEDGCTAVTLAPGATCQVKVTFNPLEIGEQSGYLLVESNGGTPFSVLDGVGSL